MKKIFKIFKTMFFFLLLFSVFLTVNLETFAENNKKVILGGNTIGLKIDTGVYVCGKYQVTTDNKKVSPWKSSDITCGDKIIAYNNIDISSNSDLLNILKNDNNESATLTLERNNHIFNTSIDIVKTNNESKSLGLYIKDKMIGIGTLTFIDPITNKYASLGHGIYENNKIIDTKSGDIRTSSIEGIKKSVPGMAGEKRASIGSTIYGTVSANKVTGIYGKMTNNKYLSNEKIQIASQSEVKIGNALIYTVVDKEKVESFDIKITSIALQSSSNIKGLKFEVIDDKLLNLTGGIVQGMSGSPIVQNGKLIGAVSHVCIDKPNIGYGIHIEWMLDDLTD